MLELKGSGIVSKGLEIGRLLADSVLARTGDEGILGPSIESSPLFGMVAGLAKSAASAAQTGAGTAAYAPNTTAIAAICASFEVRYGMPITPETQER